MGKMGEWTKIIGVDYKGRRSFCVGSGDISRLASKRVELYFFVCRLIKSPGLEIEDPYGNLRIFNQLLL